jgi:uncharacterized protein (DUF697 family)
MKKQIWKFATKQIKKTIMSSEKSSKSKHAETVIRNHVIWAMGTGFIPVPIADVFAATAVQMDMIRQLCRVYDLEFSETQGKAIVTSLTSSILARAGARSVVKLIPGLGTIIGGVTISIFNGASTYALGEVFKKHFDSGGTILDFDTERLRKVFKEKFEKGKKVAEDLKNEQDENVEEGQPVTEIAVDDIPVGESAPKKEDTLAKLKELGELKAQGVITEEEFAEMKKKLISNF